MQTAWGVILVGLSLLAWGGQVLAWLAPTTAARLGLTEDEGEVDASYWADIRGEAAWDALTLWTMAVAGVLLVGDIGAWAHFGLVGGGMYVYFAGRGVLTRVSLLRRDVRIGSSDNVRAAFVLLGIWGLTGLVTVVLAAVELS